MKTLRAQRFDSSTCLKNQAPCKPFSEPPSGASFQLARDEIHDEIYGEVQIWTLSFDVAKPLLSPLLRVLDVSEKERAERFRFECDAQRFIMSRGVLRVLLSLFTHIAPHEIGFDFNAHGKPSLNGKTNTPLHFNVSHTNQSAVFCFAREPVGIDIEEMNIKKSNIEPNTEHSKRDLDVGEIASLCLCEDEKRVMNTLSPEAQRQYFFQIWTAKEAYLKMLGCGLSQPMTNFAVAFEDVNVQDVYARDADVEAQRPLSLLLTFRRWHTPHCVLSLACASPIRHVQAYDITSDFLAQVLGC